MRGLVRHRGPDEFGEWVGPEASLGIQRLRIIDLKTGQQPVSTEDGRIRAVFNGEIYNYRELREELLERGHRLTSHGDAEVLVHLYEDEAENFLNRLRGMFAIALWDSRTHKLLLARDRLGKKPLYYARRGNELFFASEIKSLLIGCELSREIDPGALADYLAYLYIPSPRTMFREIRSLPPGHYAVWMAGELHLRRYWSLPAHSDIPRRTEQDWIEEVRQKLAEAVKIRLVSDVPLGVFLSGGLDSSLMVALMAQNGPVNSFTVGFADDGDGYSEIPSARRVAAMFGAEHHEAIINSDVLNILPRVLWYFDQPFGNSTAPLAYRLAEFARQHVTVALAGTCGDELFSGYPRHLGLRLAGAYARLPRIIRDQMLARLLTLLPESTDGNSASHRLAKRLHRFTQVGDLRGADRYLSWVTYFDSGDRLSLLSPAWRNEVLQAKPERLLMDLWSDQGDDVERAWRLDLQSFLPFNQLEYMDKMTMACSLEGRAPLCDHELIELCASMPPNLRIRGLTTKYLLKRVAEAYLPRDVVYRRKVGFDAPVGLWFKRELKPFAASFFSPGYPFRLLDGNHVQRLFSEHTSGRRDLSVHLWMLLVLEVWYELYIVQKIGEPPSSALNEVLGFGGTRIEAAGPAR